jgi:hypothetical protein
VFLSERFLWYKFFENLIEGRRLGFWVKESSIYKLFCTRKLISSGSSLPKTLLTPCGRCHRVSFVWLSTGLSRLLSYSFPFLLVKMKWKALLGNNILNKEHSTTQHTWKRCRCDSGQLKFATWKEPRNIGQLHPTLLYFVIPGYLVCVRVKQIIYVMGPTVLRRNTTNLVRQATHPVRWWWILPRPVPAWLSPPLIHSQACYPP